MRYRLTFLGGLALGYVLGSRAGRERYEQIKRGAQRVADSPAVQEAAGLAQAQAAKVFGVAKNKVTDRLPWMDHDEESAPASASTSDLNGARP